MNKAGLARALLACAVLAGCGTADRTGNRIPGRTLTIYSSAPLDGPSSANGKAVVAGARLALLEQRGRVGRYRIVLRSLDDSTPQRQGWDPVQTTVNARLAAQASTTVGYLGDLNSGASAISIPVLNRAGIPQISPWSGAVGLTMASPAASPGEPQKYYPNGIRTFARIVPSDAIQATVQVQLQRTIGCRQTYVLDDGEVDGEDMASSFLVAAQSAHLQVVGTQGFIPTATDYSSLASGVAQTPADCVLISALPGPGTTLLTEQVARAVPRAMIFATDDLAGGAFVDPAQGGIPASLDARVLVTAPVLDPASSPQSRRVFYDSYVRRFGPPEPAAIFGYESMSLLLGAIARATRRGTRPAERSKVLAAIFATRDRQSALGTYSIDSAGDTTLREYGAYRIASGQLALWRTITG